MKNKLIRYSKIDEKNKREIVLLRGSGCKWKKCRFCDYHLDYSKDANSNFELNKDILKNVTGIYEKLEVINSGSFSDLDDKTMNLIEETCKKNNIKQIHFECHWLDRDKIPKLKEKFNKDKITVKIKIGIESFDYLFRESYLIKGIETNDNNYISKYFDEVCLLQGIPGQTKEFMINDIETGLKYFERVCINIMVENSTKIKPDPRVKKIFIEEVYPIYINNDRVDILIDNTDFGVGGIKDE